MREILKEIFGKESGITEDDIKNNIINKYKESIKFECKELRSIDDKDKEQCLIKPIVSFLNTNKKHGLLALGIKAKSKMPTNIVPVNKKLLDEEKIKRYITSGISSIQKQARFPNYEIEEVKIDSENSVFFI